MFCFLEKLQANFSTLTVETSFCVKGRVSFSHHVFLSHFLDHLCN